MVVRNETIGRAPASPDQEPVAERDGDSLVATMGGLAIGETAAAIPEAPAADEMEEMAGAEIDFDRRRGIVIKGPLGMPMRIDKKFTMQEVEALWVEGSGVPLDLMPLEYWHRSAAIHDPGLYEEGDRFVMPFSEEALGDAF